MDEKGSTAFHEAAHAFVADWEDVDFEFVTIKPNPEEGEAGHIKFINPPGFGDGPRLPNDNYIERRAAAVAAGHLVDYETIDRSTFDGKVLDEFADRYCLSENEQEAFLKWIEARARAYKALYSLFIVAIAKNLRDRETLTRKEVHAVIAQTREARQKARGEIHG